MRISFRNLRMKASTASLLLIATMFSCIVIARTEDNNQQQHQQLIRDHRKHHQHSHHKHLHHQHHNNSSQSIHNQPLQQLGNNSLASDAIVDQRTIVVDNGNKTSSQSHSVRLTMVRNGHGNHIPSNFHNRNHHDWQRNKRTFWTHRTPSRSGWHGDSGVRGNREIPGFEGRGPVIIDEGKRQILKDVVDIEGRSIFKDDIETFPTTTPPQVTAKHPRGKDPTKSNDERNICMKHKTVQIPVKTTEIYHRATWKEVTEPCEMNTICTRVKMVHEPAYRDVIRHKTTRQVTYECCPGWEQPTKTSKGCTKPICNYKCRNGGTCIKPDTCSCPKGFAGKLCEKDVNECKEEKPCDQLCFNTEGSYFCKCREGFVLHTDQQSCKKTDGGFNAFEARELENDIDDNGNDVAIRIHKIEKMIGIDRVAAHELHKKVQSTSYLVDSFNTRLNSLENKQTQLNEIQQELQATNMKTKKLEELVDFLLHCRSNPHLRCP